MVPASVMIATRRRRPRKHRGQHSTSVWKMRAKSCARVYRYRRVVGLSWLGSALASSLARFPNLRGCVAHGETPEVCVR